MDEVERRAIGQKIRAARKAAKLTQVELAEKIGAKQSHISDWENGNHLPSLPYVQLLNYYLKLNLNIERSVNQAGVHSEVSMAPVRKVTVVGQVQASYWAEPNWLDSFERYELPVIEDQGYAGVRQNAWLLKGPSMNKLYPDNSYLITVDLYDLGVDPSHEDDVIVERTRPDGLIELTCKRYMVRPDGTAYLVPMSDHPAHQQPLELTDGVDNPEGIEVRVRELVIGNYQPIKKRR